MFREATGGAAPARRAASGPGRRPSATTLPAGAAVARGAGGGKSLALPAWSVSPAWALVRPGSPSRPPRGRLRRRTREGDGVVGQKPRGAACGGPGGRGGGQGGGEVGVRRGVADRVGRLEVQRLCPVRAGVPEGLFQPGPGEGERPV